MFPCTKVSGFDLRSFNTFRPTSAIFYDIEHSACPAQLTLK